MHCRFGDGSTSPDFPFTVGIKRLKGAMTETVVDKRRVVHLEGYDESFLQNRSITRGADRTYGLSGGAE